MFPRIALAVVGMALSAQAHDVISTKITWTREISRVVYKNCVSCHREGGTSFSLITYEESRPWAKAIKEEVLTRRMPPWNAVKGFGDFEHDRGLAQEQIQLIADWVEGGAPEGDKLYAPKPPRSFDEPSRRAPSTKLAVAGSVKLRGETTVAGIFAGAIPKGGALQVIARQPDGSVTPMLWLQAFNPGYNQPYWFKTPLKLPAGTVIETAPPGATVSLLTRRDSGNRRTNSRTVRGSTRANQSATVRKSVPAGAVRN